MITTLLNFLAMGGYAAFVWPAYVLAAVILGGLLWQSRRGYRRRQRELERLQQGRTRRGSAA
jgi:heme exporter protein D